MITKANGFNVGDQFFPTIDKAQAYELNALFCSMADNPNPETIANFIVQNKAKILDILTTTASSKPRARKINGGRKRRKPSSEAVNAALQDMKQ